MNSSAISLGLGLVARTTLHSPSGDLNYPAKLHNGMSVLHHTGRSGTTHIYIIYYPEL
jgi:hypothetical protein